MDYLLYLSKVLEHISFIAVDVKCTSNGLETAARTAPAHRSFSCIVVNTCQHVTTSMTFAPIYSVLFGVRKI